MQLILENVRSFSGRHEIPIRPLTVLIGENSSGKSTLLAALSVVCDPGYFPFQPRFNEPPYSLGHFDTIATNRRGRTGRSATFSLGYCTEAIGSGLVRLEVAYEGLDGQPKVSRLSLDRGGSILDLTFQHRDGDVFAEGKIVLGETSFTVRQHLEATPRVRLFFPLEWFLFGVGEFPSDTAWQYSRTAHELLFELERGTQGESVSVAPVRARPLRTYDQVTDAYDPEGDHIPFLLDQLFSSSRESGGETALKEALDRFGRDSGMYRKLDVKRLGGKPGGPFQVQITTTRQAHNLVDVGYGISQALPVVAQAAQLRPGQRLLLQQPEVHLHPRAQAALGTFFVDMVRDGKRAIVVETHSDYIVDRIRQEVAAKRIPPADVQILYLEKPAATTTVHRLDLEDCGNFVSVPDGYRSFFLEEEYKLVFGRARNRVPDR